MLELLGNGHVNIPTMVGGEFGKFYFKLGVVPSFNLLNGATVIGPVLNKENPEPYESTNLMLYKNPFQLFGRVELGGSLLPAAADHRRMARMARHSTPPAK